jgi:type IV secretory pathway TraG/TraD family ATPase VirD4
LAEFQRARLAAKVNPKNSSVSLALKKAAPLVCHSGGTNTLMIAPTRSGKGVGSIILTCLNFPGSMIIFDPKGGNDGAANFFDNMAQDLLTGMVFHVLSSGIYPREQQNLNGVLGILSQAAAQNTGEERWPVI